MRCYDAACHADHMGTVRKGLFFICERASSDRVVRDLFVHRAGTKYLDSGGRKAKVFVAHQSDRCFAERGAERSCDPGLGRIGRGFDVGRDAVFHQFHSWLLHAADQRLQPIDVTRHEPEICMDRMQKTDWQEKTLKPFDSKKTP